MKSPRFVSAKLQRDGRVKLITDEGDEFYVEMHRASLNGWPILSRRYRWRDQFDYGLKKPSKTMDPPAGGRPPKLTVVKP